VIRVAIVVALILFELLIVYLRKRFPGSYPKHVSQVEPIESNFKRETRSQLQPLNIHVFRYDQTGRVNSASGTVSNSITRRPSLETLQDGRTNNGRQAVELYVENHLHARTPDGDSRSWWLTEEECEQKRYMLRHGSCFCAVGWRRTQMSVVNAASGVARDACVGFPQYHGPRHQGYLPLVQRLAP